MIHLEKQKKVTEHEEKENFKTMLDLVKKIFDFTPSEIGKILSLTRQETLGLFSGTFDLPRDKVTLFHNIFYLAEVFQVYGIDKSMARNLLYLKIDNGSKSILDYILSNQIHWKLFIDKLIEEYLLMNKAYERSRLAQSKSPITRDWLSEISIPSMNED